MLKKIKDFFKRNNQIKIFCNNNIDSQVVSFQIDEEINTSALKFRFVLDNCFDVNHIWLKKYGLDLILVHKLDQLPHDIHFLLCLTSESCGTHEEIYSAIESPWYYLDSNGEKIIIYDGLSGNQLLILKNEFVNVKFIDLKYLKLKLDSNKSPNSIIKQINQQITSYNMVENYGIAILDTMFVNINFEKNIYKFAMLHSLFNYQKRYFSNNNVLQLIESHNAKFQARHKNAIVIHCYYLDLMSNVLSRVQPLKDDFDFFISIPISISEEQVISLFNSKINFRVELLSDNQGRDIAPFLRVFKYLSNYNWVLKIHTKKSLHRNDGHSLRNELWNILFNINLSNYGLDHGLIAPKEYMLNFNAKESYMSLNLDNLKQILKQLKIKSSVNYFVAGSMFWFRPLAMKQLADLHGLIEFPFECGQNDGEIQHAIERIFCILVEYNGYDVQFV